MNKFNIEDGELEMLAMGQVSAMRELELYQMLDQDSELRAEFEAIELSLEKMAFESAHSAPKEIGVNLHEELFAKETKVVPFYKTSVFRAAASILFIGSILANIYLLQSKSDQTVADTEEPLTRKEEFLAELPMPIEDFEGLFDYLHESLENEPCKMDFRVTKAFLNNNHLAEDQIMAYLIDEGGRCDCEILMNFSLEFPQEPYKHGMEPPKTHRDAEIKLAIIGKSPYGRNLAFDAKTMKIYL
ncbi:DUF2695 domain-containing protein [Jiulongibacter sp. NS-SX5]|uniref:DUF2695 domain-containing protein n=1 Tax=Jiulongibacter sp. NS-SX5 TaxID=3463854 RepID=UPI0040599744